MFDLKDPKHPQTDGWYYTCECQHEHGFGGNPDNGWQSTTVSSRARSASTSATATD